MMRDVIGRVFVKFYNILTKYQQSILERFEHNLSTRFFNSDMIASVFDDNLTSIFCGFEMDTTNKQILGNLPKTCKLLMRSFRPISCVLIAGGNSWENETESRIRRDYNVITRKSRRFSARGKHFLPKSRPPASLFTRANGPNVTGKFA